jgi:NDP-sugar pyrophosphorylase family protein
MYQTKQLFDLTHTQASEYLAQFTYPWDALPGLKSFIERLGEVLDKDEYAEIAPKVWAHKSAKIAQSASIHSPCIIGADTEIRHCAFIRGSALIGKNCVVGNSTELKNVILFDGVQVPHYNYVGDSILGYKSHMGAGAITSNVKSDKTPVVIKDGAETEETGLKKVGAFLGDFVEVGCNSVLNPGTVIGKNSNVYPLSCVRGTVKEKSIYKTFGVTVEKE